jgi:hypothetical protein
MRKVLALLPLATLAACATPAHWEKPGADDAAVKADLTYCAAAARTEAFQNYAFDTGFMRFGAPWWGYPYRPSQALWRQRLDSDRFYAETRLKDFCMRNKGYELVPDAPPPAADRPAADK